MGGRSYCSCKISSLIALDHQKCPQASLVATSCTLPAGHRAEVRAECSPSCDRWRAVRALPRAHTLPLARPAEHAGSLPIHSQAPGLRADRARSCSLDVEHLSRTAGAPSKHCVPGQHSARRPLNLEYTLCPAPACNQIATCVTMSQHSLQHRRAASLQEEPQCPACCASHAT